jgi:hypothetical protein
MVIQTRYPQEDCGKCNRADLGESCLVCSEDATRRATSCGLRAYRREEGIREAFYIDRTGRNDQQYI